MNGVEMAAVENVLAGLPQKAAWITQTYEDLHRAPELSMLESETAEFIRVALEKAGYDVQRIGGGVVGILRNGDGPTVLFRADIDALTVTEDTGLPYASTTTMKDADGVEWPVMHACGHDMHITAGLAAAQLLAEGKDHWGGTYVALFQPGEETAAGAKAMVADGLVDKVGHVDVCLAQHVLTYPAAGKVGTLAGPFLSQAASLRITFSGKGSHGSMPHLGIDTVLMACQFVQRLQGIVSREVAPGEFAVVTVGSLQAGTKANIIPDKATALLNIRAYSPQVAQQLIEAITRIAQAEAAASNAPVEPVIEVFDEYPLTNNDEAVTQKVTEAFVAHFGQGRVVEMPRQTASEDFSTIPTAFGAPYSYWGFGGYPEGAEAYPNHNPRFAPVQDPTLATGTQAVVVAVLAHLDTTPA